MGNTQLVVIAKIRVNKKHIKKIDWNKVFYHVQQLEHGKELYPIDLHKLCDGKFTIAGNGRHRYFAYVHAGYSNIPAIVYY
jgi:hypothetical protein